MANNRPERYTNLIHARVPQDGSRTVTDYRFFYDDPRRYGLTVDPSGIGVPTPAEVAAGVTPVNYAYAPFDIRRYWSGTGDIDSAFSAAVAVAATNGGCIRIPAGSYTASDSTKWNLNQKQGIVIEGDGATTAGASNATIITYTGTGSTPWITMDSANGIQIRNMTLKHSSSSFTGPMIKIGNNGNGDASQCSLVDVIMDAGLNTAYHLDLNKAIVSEFIRCYFAGGAVSIKGQASDGSGYSNEIRFQTCQWLNAAACPVNYGGQSWTFDSCNFENRAGGVAAAFQALVTTPCSGLNFRGCWFGDASSGSGTWITVFGPGFVATGNHFEGTASSNAIELNGVAGAVITGNVFNSFNTALNLASSASKGLVFAGNNFVTGTVTNQIGSAGSFGDGPSSVVNPNQGMVGASGGLAPYFGAGVQGWEYTANGLLEIWGQKSITAGTGATLTYATEVSNFPGFSAVYNVQVSGLNPSAGTVGNVYAATFGTTAVNINANGTGTVTVCWRVKGKG